MQSRSPHQVYKSWCSVASVLFRLAPRFLCLRKRRRQQYHRKKISRPNFGKRKGHDKQTMDNGKFEDHLKAMRRVCTIQQKLEVVKYYEELVKRKRDAKRKFQEPRPVACSKSERVAWLEERTKAGKDRFLAVNKMCQQKFPNIVHGSRVARWLKTSRREKWSDLPEALRTRCTDTPNCWRTQVGAPRKARAIGGSVPIPLQVELDLLMVEMSSGISSISERKEIVSAEHVASWHPVGAF